jgi:hypothetical protein
MLSYDDLWVMVDTRQDETGSASPIVQIWVYPRFMRKSTVRNAKSADFGQFLRKCVLSELNSPASVMDQSHYRPSEMLSGLFPRQNANYKGNAGALADNYGRFQEIPKLAVSIFWPMPLSSETAFT